MRWRNPKEAGLIMAKVILALVGAMVVTAIVVIILPINDFSVRTPGRVVQVGVFYSVWAFLLFKLLFGEYIPRSAFKTSEQ